MNDNFDQLLDRFLNYLRAERNASPYTIRNYIAAIQEFFGFLRGKKICTLEQVDRYIWRDFSSHLMERLSKASIAQMQSAIRSFFNYLTREEILMANPLKKAPSPKLDKLLPSFLNVAETVRLLEAPDLSKPEGQRDRALLELLYASGLRVSELVNLDINQVDLATSEIRVWGKGSKERVVLIGEPAAQALGRYINHDRPELLGSEKTRAVFLTRYATAHGIRYGERLSVRRVQKILEHYAKTIGKKVHPHTLRHTFATHMLDGGADLRVVQELLGHAQLSSTQIYTHVTQSRARKVYLSAHPLAKQGNNDNR